MKTITNTINGYKLAKYRAAAASRARTLRIERYNNMDEHELRDVELEREVLSNWIKSLSMPREQGMRKVLINENTYDGNDFNDISIKGLNKDFSELDIIKMNYAKKEIKRGTIEHLDTKKRLGIKIDMFKLMIYLASINEIRDLVYNNKWGIVVIKPKSNNYPENVVLSTLKDILLDGVNASTNEYDGSVFSKYNETIWGKRNTDRQKLLLIWSSAPSDTILGKTWAMFNDLEYSDKDQTIGWQNDKDSFKTLTKKEGNAIKKEMMNNLNQIKSEVREAAELYRCNNIPGWINLLF